MKRHLAIMLVFACSPWLGAGSPALAGAAEPVASTSLEAGRLPSVSLGFGLPELNMRGFGHVEYGASWNDPDAGSNTSSNQFANGGVDLFITSQLSDGFSFLNETIFEFGGEDGDGNILDVERVLLKYEYRDWLKANLGRGHTALGYWNGSYHHGTWLQTTATRPLIYSFEDDGGILPVHFVGFEILGNVVTGIGTFEYTVTVANGRGKITDSVQLTKDANDAKAVGLHFRYSPKAIPGLGIGATGYFDKIPKNRAPDPGTGGARTKDMDELLAGAHLVYLRRGWEFLSEFFFIQHENKAVGKKDFKHNGGYAQIAHRWNKFKPYYRFDWMSIDSDDPFYSGLAEDSTQHSVGVRWEMRRFVAVKTEYRIQHTDSFDDHAIAVQFSFGF